MARQFALVGLGSFGLSVLEKLADDRFAFTVGKNKGRALDDLDPGYLRWAVNNMTLRAEEKQVLEAAYARRMRG